MLNIWFVAFLLLGIVCGFLCLDAKILKFVEKLRHQFHPFIHDFFKTISFTPFVVTTLYIIPAVFVYIYLDFFSLVALTLACMLATGLAFVGKYLFRRVRPLGNTTYLGKIDSAFPSAHTAGSFVAAFTISFFWPAYSIPFFTVASLVAISRIYLELHFFSDVLGGILLAYLMMNFTLDSSILTSLGL